MEPFRTYQVIKTLCEETGLEIEMHTHNDFGMAVANAIAGIHGGATWVNVTVGGLGERAGNAALEEVVMALKYVEGFEQLQFDTKRFRELGEYVAQAAGRTIPVWKSIIGTNMFAHESGIHADGVIKNPKTYEVFAPEEVGLSRQIVIGKHSGSKAHPAQVRRVRHHAHPRAGGRAAAACPYDVDRAEALALRQGAAVHLQRLPAGA